MVVPKDAAQLLVMVFYVAAKSEYAAAKSQNIVFRNEERASFYYDLELKSVCPRRIKSLIKSCSHLNYMCM